MDFRLDSHQEIHIMKTLARLTLVLCAIAAPTLSFAQSNQAPLTRAQVRADLARLEQAGYDPGAVSVNYPADLEAAEAKIAAQKQHATGAVGGIAEAGTSAAGTHAERPAAATSSCVGPASFCNPYFGG
jgi:Domain of unknown function (DUF4148)